MLVMCNNARKKTTETPAHKSLPTLNEKNRKQLDLKFWNVHAVIKQNRPITDYMWLNELDVPLIIWDFVPTMVEIAIFWFQIHITNGLNFMHRKWHTGNQYMVKSAENRMHSNLELFPVINVKSRPRYISALKKVVPDISRPKKFGHYFDALNEREIGR